jgi:DNA repair ATPase RecN
MNTTDPLVDAIFTAPPESQSLLRDLMEAKVAESVTHFCEQRADEIQTTIADSSQTISDTGTEIANKSDALKQVQDELKNNPGDTDLQNRAKKLSDEIAHAKQEQENAQNDLDNATTDKDLNEAAAKDAENAKTRANKDAQHRSDEVFPDGGDR